MNSALFSFDILVNLIFDEMQREMCFQLLLFAFGCNLAIPLCVSRDAIGIHTQMSMADEVVLIGEFACLMNHLTSFLH